MNQNIRRGLLGTLFAGGLLALGCTAASAADTTSGANGILSGTQVVAPVNAPITLGATSLGLLGDSTATTNTGGTNGTGGNTAPVPAGSTTSGSDGIGSGTQVVAPVTVPINLGATSLGLLGDSTATNTSGTNGTGGNTTPAPAGSTNGSDGILSGTQVAAPVTVPISVGSVSVGVAGDSTATVVTPSAGNEPVTGVPAITTPVTNTPAITPGTNTPAITTPVTNVPAITAPATNTPIISAAAASSPMMNLAASAATREAAVISPAAAPMAASMLARTGADTNLVVLAVLFLAGGLLMMLVARRRNA